MKKNKTSLNISSFSNSDFDPNIDKDLKYMEHQSQMTDHQILLKKYDLLKKQTEQLKKGKNAANQEINALKKVLFKNGDLHEVLELQHSKIFELETNLQVLQGKYDRLLSSNGSSQQTELAIKCKELEKRLQQRQIEHQKEISQLKSKMMKMNASQLYNTNNSSLYELTGATRLNTLSAKSTISPIRNSKKLV